MSCVIVVSPVLTAAWSVLAAAVAGGAAAAGFRVESSVQRPNATRVELEVESAEIEAAAADRVIAVSSGIRAIFTRGEQGTLKLCMEGGGGTEEELRAAGRDLLNRVTQQFVYHRLVTELKRRHLVIIDEQVAPDRTVKLCVRNPL